MNIEFSFIVIDDNELDCFVTQKFLERNNKNLLIQTFQNAHRALETIRENPNRNNLIPTIILLDLQMPFMNGFDFVEEFERLPAEVQKNYRIIILTVLTSVGNPADIYRILTYGAVRDIVQKPLTKEKLISLLNFVKSGI
jgi:CheY-like chemotaxis protein